MKIGNHHIKLDPSITQVSPSNRNYQVIRVEKDLTIAPKWIGKAEKYHWIITVRYENGEKDKFHFDYYDTCIKKECFK